MSSYEEWRPIPGWEGYYSASNLGRIRSEPRVITNSNGYTSRLKGCILRTNLNQGGYVRVDINKNGVKFNCSVHRLVLMAFRGMPTAGLEACHFDGDRTNNNINNLRWDTRSANTYDRIGHGTHPFAGATHCKNGHPFYAANTYHTLDGKRACRACKHESRRRRTHAKREAQNV